MPCIQNLALKNLTGYIAIALGGVALSIAIIAARMRVIRL